MNCTHFLGYKNATNGNLVILEEEAKVVRKIYEMYIEGKTPTFIARYLTESHIPTPAHKEVWLASTVRRILTNEKYIGDFLISKNYTTGFLDKESGKNTSHKFQVHIENHHPAIIDKETFDCVQSKIKTKCNSNTPTSNKSALAGKLYCAKCGKRLTHRVLASRGKSKYDIWTCRNKYDYDNNEQCQLTNYRQEIIELGYVCAVKQLLSDRSQYLAKYNQKMVDIQKESADSNSKSAIADFYSRLDGYYNQVDKLSAKIDSFGGSDISILEMQSLLDKIDNALNNINRLKQRSRQLNESANSIAKMQDLLRYVEDIDTFDNELFRTTINRVFVNDDSLTYRFNGNVTMTISTKELKKEFLLKSSTNVNN